MNSKTDTGAMIIERPDGYYWTHPETGKEFGPFTDRHSLLADMEYDAESNYEPGETLAEAEDEIGISGWLDPDTGCPAEHITHIEDH